MPSLYSRVGLQSTMKIYLLMLLLLLLAVGSRVALGDDGKACDTSRHPEQPATRLRKQLFCNYDILLRPANNHSVPTEVRVYLLILNIEILEWSRGHTAEIHTLVVWRWMDEYLNWKSSEHDGIKQIYTPSSILWLPDVMLFNPSEHQSLSEILNRGRCVLYSRGQVACFVDAGFRATCKADSSPWPFDTRYCTLTFTTTNDGANNYVNLSLLYNGYSVAQYEPNREWQLMNVTAVRLSESYFVHFNDRTLKYVFTLRRHSALYTATILASALVLGVMTAASFWIDALSPARLTLCCINVFVQCLFLQHLQYTVGSNGDTCPRIVLFYRDSLLLAAGALLAAVLALRLSCSTDKPPACISGAARWLLEYRVMQALLVGELNNKVSPAQKLDEEAVNVADNSEDISEVKDSTDKWIFLVNLLDRISFYIFIIVYFILMIVRIS